MKTVKESDNLIPQEGIYPKDILHTPEEVELTANFIDETIPTGEFTDEDMIIAFEQIDEECTDILLVELPEYMQRNKDDRIDKFDKFFKEVHAIIRKKAEASPKYVECLCQINHDLFVGSSPTLNPLYYNQYVHCAMTYEEAHAAFQALLNHLDPNVSDFKYDCWEGFWELIGTEDGEIKYVQLFDTMHREGFWVSFRENKKQSKNKRKK